MGVALLMSVVAYAQGGSHQPGQLLVTGDQLSNPENTPALVHPVPHPRQVKWMRTEFYAFFHFGMNTFTGNEWGEGNDNPNTYNPTAEPDPAQWLATAKKGHMKGGIAVVKHHDGFCLWPTQTTDYCISNSSGTYAKTDIPEAFAAAAQDLNMKYGFYISPWDRNNQYYGTDSYVSNVFLKQCKELANYGSDQFEMWFDGANGGQGYYGSSTKHNVSVDKSTYYDVPNLRYMVHKLTPDCILWGVGGEARWIGNEDGIAQQTNWCTVNRVEGDGGGGYGNGQENGWMWVPGESDAKASTNGWFWSSSKDSYKSAEALFKMYLQTVGRNSTFILNLPPTTNGKLSSSLVSTIESLGNLLTQRLGTNLATSAKGASIKSDGTTACRTAGQTINYGAANVIDGDEDTYYATADGQNTCSITIDLGAAKTIHYVMMQEHIALGQRVKAFNLQYSTDGSSWQTFGQGETFTTIGYKRIIPWDGNTNSYGSAGVQARYVRLNVTDSKACPCIENIEIF